MRLLTIHLTILLLTNQAYAELSKVNVSNRIISVGSIHAWHCTLQEIPIINEFVNNLQVSVTNIHGPEEPGKQSVYPCTVIDVGMNDGYYTILSAALGCRVYSFELQETCIEIANAAIKANNFPSNQISIISHPVSSETGTPISLLVPNICTGTFTFSYNRKADDLLTKSAVSRRNYSTVALQSFMKESKIFSDINQYSPSFNISILKIDT